jgi:hypothetical protein
MLSCEYILGCILGFFCLLCWTVGAGAQQLALDGLALDNVGERIQLRFGVRAEEIDLLEEALKSSGRLRMQCDIRMQRNRSWWPDETVAKKSLVYNLKSNPLTQTYRLTNCQNEQDDQDGDLKELVHRKWQEITLDLGPWDLLHPGSPYILELSLQFKRPDVPAWLKTALFFWSWDVLFSQTFRMHFTY